MICWKGTDKDMKCNGFQFEVGKTYEEAEAKMCVTGFHACENPLDVLRFYPPPARYFKVELEANEQKGMSSKRVGKRITILEEVEMEEMIREGVQCALVQGSCIVDNDSAIAHSDSANTSIGSGSGCIVANSYSTGMSVSFGSKSITANSGVWSTSVSSGCGSIAANSGDESRAINFGDDSIAASSGWESIAANSGDDSIAIKSGIGGYAQVESRNSIAIAAGLCSKAMGALGNWLVLVERNKYGDILQIKSVKVDGVAILPETFYRLKNGVVVKVAGG